MALNLYWRVCTRPETSPCASPPKPKPTATATAAVTTASTATATTRATVLAALADLALVLALATSAGCTVEGASTDLGTLDSAGPGSYWVDASSITPRNCGDREVLDIQVTNTGDAPLQAAATFQDTGHWNLSDNGFTSHDPRAPRALAPGESTTFSKIVGTYHLGLGDQWPDVRLLTDIDGAELDLSSLDTGAPTPALADVAVSHRCDPGSHQASASVPRAFDPAGVAVLDHPLDAVTPATCATGEIAGVRVTNTTDQPLWVWPAFSVDTTTMPDWDPAEGEDGLTIYRPPVQLGPGDSQWFGEQLASGIDVTSLHVLADPGDSTVLDPTSLAALGVEWVNTCATTPR